MIGSDKHVDHEKARQLAAHYDPSSPKEQALVRKLDWRWVVCFLKYWPSPWRMSLGGYSFMILREIETSWCYKRGEESEGCD